MSEQLTVMKPTGQLQQAFGAFTPAVLVEQVQMIQQAMATVMHDKEHYGTIPGCGDKPTLLKAGAEKLCFMFRLAPEYKVEIVDIGCQGHREYRVTCRLTSIQSGSFVGEGVGSCSTMESKYRYRTDKGSEEMTDVAVPREYWDQKKAGNNKALGAILANAIGEPGRYGTNKNNEGTWVITRRGESAGKVENQDIADVYNTCLKMAKKRASVDATLTATAASDIFAQDLEDMHGEQEFPANVQQQQPEQPNGNGGHRPPAKAPWQILSERIDATDALLVKEYGRQESIFTQEWAFRCKRDLGLETASMKDWTPEQIAAASNVAKTIKAEVVDWENKMKKPEPQPEPTAMPTTGPELLVYINQLSEKYKDLLKPNQLRTDIQTQGTLARPAFAPLIQDWTPAQVNKILDWLNHYVGVLEDAKVKAG